jgi:NAD(P)H-hydrate epimerase
LPEKRREYVVMTRQQVRDFDAHAINDLAIPGVVLMENAGRGAAEVIIERLPRDRKTRVCLFCGTGNNGGDGYVIARHLVNNGVKTQTIICGDAAKIKGDALINLNIIKAMNLPVRQLEPASGDLVRQVRDLTGGCDIIVDAIFGTGLKGQLAGEYVQLISCINATGIDIVAVDIPSGLDCDTGEPLPVCVEASATVTFAAVKKAFAEYPDCAQTTGEVYVASIGIEP